MKAKQLSKMLASLTAGVLIALSAVPPAFATEDPILGTLPDWVPENFASAMQFYNTHGKSYVSDGIICLVRPMLQWKTDDYRISLSGTMTQVNTPAGSEPKIYELDIPDKPAEDAFIEEVMAYNAYCDSIGLYSHDYSFFETYANCKTQYAFEVALFRVLDDLDLTVAWEEKTGDEWKTTEKFSFANKGGKVTETDLFGWLPDSRSEFKAFSEKYGMASVQGNYIAYCAEVNGSTGESLKMKQSGKGKISLSLESDCNGFTLVPVDGGSSSSVMLYQPEADGDVEVQWTISQAQPGAPESVTAGQYTISDICTVITDRSADRKGQTIFSFIDRDTQELIEIPADPGNVSFRRDTREEPYTSEFFDITSNPCTVDSLQAYQPENYSYAFDIFTPAGRYINPLFTVTEETDTTRSVTCELEWLPSGDANSDRSFNQKDLDILAEWLTTGNSAKLEAGGAVDFCRDGKLDAADLTLMKRKLMSDIKPQPEYVEPDIRTEWGALGETKIKLKLYSGPDESYSVITEIPAGTSIQEYGFQKELDDWMFTLYRDQYGWIKTVDADGRSTLFYVAVADKPVIYLYPEEETDVHLELELTEADLATTYPKYNGGWDVTAYPDGSLLNKADGSHHRYLFWDAVNCRTRFDFSEGFCVAGADTEQFFKEKLTYMGLTEEEMNEFIVYWLPRMERNAYNLIAFQGDAYTETAKLTVTPAPDSECRIFMAYVPLETAVEIAPQELEPFERTGFALVEWGGVEVSARSPRRH